MLTKVRNGEWYLIFSLETSESEFDERYLLFFIKTKLEGQTEKKKLSKK